MYYLILPITNVPAPHSQIYPVAPLLDVSYLENPILDIKTSTNIDKGVGES